MSGLFGGFRDWRSVEGERDGGPFELGCSFSQPASRDEIRLAWKARPVDGQVVDLWLECREARLFEDVEYGQWGLRILSPSESAMRTEAQAMEWPSDMRSDDVVVGEFLGDQELLVLAPSERADRVVLIALPLDPRPDWAGAGSTLEHFFRRYLEAQGEKFWELGRR